MDERSSRAGRSLQDRLHYWRDIMNAKSGWAGNVSGPCCDKCRMPEVVSNPLRALVGCRDPFQIECNCHVAHREAVRQLIIRELEAVEVAPLSEQGRSAMPSDKEGIDYDNNDLYKKRTAIWNDAILEVCAVLAIEDIANDPDDLYTGRFHRLNRIRAMKRPSERPD